jgi:uncharacterized protein (DUF433 family)
MSYQDIISIEPGKRGGRPCIRHMRIAMVDVLGGWPPVRRIGKYWQIFPN